MGWVLTFRVLGNAFNSRALFILHIVCCIVLLVVWLVLFSFTLIAFQKKFILISEPEDIVKDSLREIEILGQVQDEEMDNGNDTQMSMRRQSSPGLSIQ